MNFHLDPDINDNLGVDIHENEDDDESVVILSSDDEDESSENSIIDLADTSSDSSNSDSDSDNGNIADDEDESDSGISISSFDSTSDSSSTNDSDEDDSEESESGISSSSNDDDIGPGYGSENYVIEYDNNDSSEIEDYQHQHDNMISINNVPHTSYQEEDECPATEFEFESSLSQTPCFHQDDPSALTFIVQYENGCYDYVQMYCQEEDIGGELDSSALDSETVVEIQPEFMGFQASDQQSDENMYYIHELIPAKTEEFYFDNTDAEMYELEWDQVATNHLDVDNDNQLATFSDSYANQRESPVQQPILEPTFNMQPHPEAEPESNSQLVVEVPQPRPHCRGRQSKNSLKKFDLLPRKSKRFPYNLRSGRICKASRASDGME